MMNAKERERLRASLLKATTRAEVNALLMNLDKEDILDFLEEECEKLLKMVEGIPDLIYEGLEEDLASDMASKNEAESVLAKIRSL